MSLRLPSRQFDQLQQLAAQHRVSMQALARFALRRLFKAADLSRQAKR